MNRTISFMCFLSLFLSFVTAGCSITPVRQPLPDHRGGLYRIGKTSFMVFRNDKKAVRVCVLLHGISGQPLFRNFNLPARAYVAAYWGALPRRLVEDDLCDAVYTPIFLTNTITSRAYAARAENFLSFACPPGTTCRVLGHSKGGRVVYALANNCRFKASALGKDGCRRLTHFVALNPASEGSKLAYLAEHVARKINKRPWYAITQGPGRFFIERLSIFLFGLNRIDRLPVDLSPSNPYNYTPPPSAGGWMNAKKSLFASVSGLIDYTRPGAKGGGCPSLWRFWSLHAWTCNVVAHLGDRYNRAYPEYRRAFFEYGATHRSGRSFTPRDFKSVYYTDGFVTIDEGATTCKLAREVPINRRVAHICAVVRGASHIAFNSPRYYRFIRDALRLSARDIAAYYRPKVPFYANKERKAGKR